MLLMDLHAHMSSYEVIGLLGGTWDPERLAIRIVAAFPCRRVQGSHSSTGVELDPEDEVATRALMDRDGLKPVGWSVSPVLDFKHHRSCCTCSTLKLMSQGPRVCPALDVLPCR